MIWLHTVQICPIFFNDKFYNNITLGSGHSTHLKVFFTNWLILECEISLSEDFTTDVTLNIGNDSKYYIIKQVQWKDPLLSKSFQAGDDWVMALNGQYEPSYTWDGNISYCSRCDRLLFSSYKPSTPPQPGGDTCCSRAGPLARRISGPASYCSICTWRGRGRSLWSQTKCLNKTTWNKSCGRADQQQRTRPPPEVLNRQRIFLRKI